MPPALLTPPGMPQPETAAATAAAAAAALLDGESGKSPSDKRARPSLCDDSRRPTADEATANGGGGARGGVEWLASSSLVVDVFDWHSRQSVAVLLHNRVLGCYLSLHRHKVLVLHTSRPIPSCTSRITLGQGTLGRRMYACESVTAIPMYRACVTGPAPLPVVLALMLTCP